MIAGLRVCVPVPGGMSRFHVEGGGSLVWNVGTGESAPHARATRPLELFFFAQKNTTKNEKQKDENTRARTETTT